ncbi:methyltransferase [Cucumis melo var. makuwa]|uniref:Methyltransferase n=1 Tax=Cucumis melo var. makuwa TaxID=1194695 RepID=A0A5D3BKU2_CUCMM|nr:methyltransferase [Cucumis melo var. makuwa]
MALSHMGVHDVTGVELIDSPPLMERAVRPNVVCVIVVEECGDYEVKEIVQNSLLNNMKCQRKSTSLAGPLLVLRSVHFVELCGIDQYFAMKAMDKGVMLNRNKIKAYKLKTSFKLRLWNGFG